MFLYEFLRFACFLRLIHSLIFSTFIALRPTALILLELAEQLTDSNSFLVQGISKIIHLGVSWFQPVKRVVVSNMQFNDVLAACYSFYNHFGNIGAIRCLELKT